MAINVRLTRAWIFVTVTCLVLLGPATGALGADASAASRAPSVAAPAERSSVAAPRPLSQLFGVACTSPASCWAVGRINKVPLNEALHWDGRRWSPVPAPRPGDASALDGVSCAAPASCWAVGYYDSPTAQLNEALHWNGRRWSLVATPSPGGTAAGGVSFLAGVRCTSPGNCWAVGTYTKGPGAAPFLTEALHWNGRRWSLIATPSPAGTAAGDSSNLSDLRCFSAASCWAVGDYAPAGRPGVDLNLALHWNGRRWSQVTTPNPGVGNALNGVACASPVSCWAVGTYTTAGSPGSPGANLDQALHWNGRRWSQVRTPDPDGTGGGAVNELSDVTCTSPAGCWAVGDFGTISGNTGIIENQVLRWNGRTWSLVHSPDPGGLANGDSNFLDRVRCASAASCWAVGYGAPAGQANRNQALHWNGRKWTTGLP
jgi:hypothetical protein